MLAHGEERGDRLRDVRQVGDDAVAAADAERAQARRDAARSARAARPRSSPPAARSSEACTIATASSSLAAEDVLGVAQLARPGTTRRPASRVGRARARTASTRWTSKNSQIERPERLEVVDRPPPEVVVAVEARGRASAAASAGSAVSVARSTALGRRLPEQSRHGAIFAASAPLPVSAAIGSCPNGRSAAAPTDAEGDAAILRSPPEEVLRMSGSAIAVGVDGSQESRAALRWALDEARLRRLPLNVLYAWCRLFRHSLRAPRSRSRTGR